MRVSLRIALSITVAGALLGFLMLYGGVDPLDALTTIGRLPLGIFLTAVALHVFTYLMRAARLNVMIPAQARPGLRRSLMVSAAHNMASYVLPAKTGEAALVVYLRTHAGVGPSVGLACLLVGRFLDGAMLCCGLSVACLWLHLSGRYEALTWLASVSGALVAAALFFVALSLRGDLLVRLVQALVRGLWLGRTRLGARILARANGLALALRAAGDAGRLLRAGLLTVPQWMSIFGFYAVLVAGLAARSFSFAEVTFGSSLASLANILPVNGGAGVGTQELGWVAGFHRLLGADYQDALSTCLGVHLVQLFDIVVMGLIAHLAMGIVPRLRFDEPAEG